MGGLASSDSVSAAASNGISLTEDHDMLCFSQEKVHQNIKTGAETSGARGPGKCMAPINRGCGCD